MIIRRECLPLAASLPRSPLFWVDLLSPLHCIHDRMRDVFRFAPCCLLRLDTGSTRLFVVDYQPRVEWFCIAGSPSSACGNCMVEKKEDRFSNIRAVSHKRGCILELPLHMRSRSGFVTLVVSSWTPLRACACWMCCARRTSFPHGLNPRRAGAFPILPCGRSVLCVRGGARRSTGYLIRNHVISCRI